MAFQRISRPSLYCVELRSAHWERAIAWYREVLNLRVLVRVVDDGYALFAAGDTRLAIIKRTAVDEPSGRWSLGFEVEDLEGAAQRLEAAGSELSRPARDPEGFQEILTQDPDGNAIRLFAWPLHS